MKTQTVFTFLPYFNGYFTEGKWHDAHGRELKVKHYNGRNCLHVEGKRYGVKKLRQYACKELKIIHNLPF